MHPRHYDDGPDSWRPNEHWDWRAQRLVVHRHGHEVTVDHGGLSIDGHRIVRDRGLEPEHAVRPSQDPRTNNAFQVLPSGAVVYKGYVVAELSRSEVTVHGPAGPAWPPAPATRTAPHHIVDYEEIDL